METTTTKKPGKKWNKNFLAEYKKNGGWNGYGTMCWVWTAALYLHSQGVSGKAAGRILAAKQQENPEFTKFAESAGNTATVLYIVRGNGNETDEDRKVFSMLRNGAHLKAVAI